MDRIRPALIAAVVVAVFAVGSALAVSQPRQTAAPVLADETAEPVEVQENEEPPTEADVAHAVERLQAAGYSTDATALAALAADHGVGGAVRLVAWSGLTGLTIDELAARRADGMGWGQIARELDVHPGLGSIMGNGGGNGRENAPGQLKKDDGDS